MRKRKFIAKHFAYSTVSANDQDSSLFYMKSQGQNWIQLHNETSFIDAIALPYQLRMAKIEGCFKQPFQPQRMQYIFSLNNNIFIGNCNDLGTEIYTHNLKFQQFAQMSNVLCIQNKKYCSIGINGSSASKLNIVQKENQVYKTHSYALDFAWQQHSKIAYNSEHIYVPCSKGAQSLLSFNLQKQATTLQFYLPTLDDYDKIKECFTLSNKQQINQIICVFSKNWLAMGDLRMKKLITVYETNNCHSAFSFFNDGVQKIYFTQFNCLYQYDLRRATKKREPIITLQQNILNAYQISHTILGIQNDINCGLNLYSANF